MGKVELTVFWAFIDGAVKTVSTSKPASGPAAAR